MSINLNAYLVQKEMRCCKTYNEKNMSLRKNKAAYGIWSVTMVSHAKTIDEARGYLKENINDSRHKKHTKDIYIKKQKHHKSIPTRTDKGD